MNLHPLPVPVQPPLRHNHARYDDLGRLLTVQTPEANQTPISYQYNSFNLVTQRTDARGVITTYGYDTLNRLTSMSYNVGSTGVPATASATLTYGTSSAQNNNGRLLTVTDGAGSETHSYDVLGQITQNQKVITGTSYTTSYAYNLAGELSSITYPSGRIVEQAYDAIGRLCRVGGTNGTSCTATSPFASGFGYDTAFQVTGFNYGNGVAAAFGYSADRLQLTSLSYTKSPTTLLSLSYGYTQSGGNNGQMTSITDNTGTQEAGRSVTYSYDALYRLSTAVTTGSAGYPQWGLSWTYDRYGNRLSQAQTFDAPPTNSVAVSATTNRITDPGYSYDANGNMTNDGANTMTYDAENRAVTSGAGGTTTTYTYDGASLRVKKQVGAGTATVYIFSGSKVIAEYAAGAPVISPQREYIYTGSQLVATIEGSATKYHHSDHLSLRVTTDASGVKIADSGHYPYGENWYETGGANKLKFTTYARDNGSGESGNDYAMFRSYVNRLGRFSSPDPIAGSIADPQSLNRYAYTLNDPGNLVDPLGLFCYHRDGNWTCVPPVGGGGSIVAALAGGAQIDLLGIWTPVGTVTDIEGYIPGTDLAYGTTTVIGYWTTYASVSIGGDIETGTGGGGDPIEALKAKVKDLFKNKPKCAALFGNLDNALKQIKLARVYPPGTFNPSVPGSVAAAGTLAKHPHGAAYAAGNIFLGPQFFNQSLRAQQTIFIHELRHQAYNTGEPPITSPAYQAHRRREDAGIVAACGTEMPKKP